ncbi:hypothetical protein BIV57_04255 [Mangrovactinospora gilvigrisea]|uniref:LamG-like jellyroll fold domain-containing protein n=1 Tax=Mangrovactinospora gilvigrisea TaxID=1428644 RepID=A0A1J7BJ54_9ACTN|nr:hypothetical protein BIV57_04255 [Mangrovactinospora gilvigrisea]
MSDSNSKDLRLTHPDTYQRYSEKRIQLAAEATAGEWRTVDFQWRRYTTDADSGWIQIPPEDLTPRPAQWPAPVEPAPAADASTEAAAGGVVSPTFAWDAVRTVPSDGQIQVRARFFTDDGPAPVPAADGQWLLNEDTGRIANDWVAGNNGVLSPSVTWSSEHGGSVVFNGTNGEIATSGPAVDTTGSFTVAGWVKAAAGKQGIHTFLIQPGRHVSAFYLEYWSGGEFVFSRPLADSVPGSVSVRAPFQANRWTHVAGVYDVGTNEMTLYLDGVARQTAVFTGTGFASGPLTMGHGFVSDQVGNWADGSLSDVRAFNRALTPAQISDLVAPAAASPGATAAVEVTLDRFGLADSHAIAKLDPGRVSLLTGAFEVTDADVSIGSHSGGMGLSRTFVSSDPDSEESGLFGPGWRSIIKVPGAGADYQALVDTGPGAVEIREEGGSMLPFVQESGTMTGPATYKGVSDAAAMHLTLEFDGQRTYALTDRAGNSVTFTRRGSGVGHGGWKVPAYFLPLRVTLAAPDASAARLSQVTYDAATGWPTEVDAANPNGGLCTPGSFMAGCRALVFHYEDLPGGKRCTRVSYKHQDNGSGGAAPAPILMPVAEYAYDDTHGRLVKATDPRTNLATAYTYDADGRLETVTPPGEAPWHLHYTPDPQDPADTWNADGPPTHNALEAAPPAHARLTKVVRTHDAEHGGTSESTAVVYGLPLSGPGLPDLSAASVARWAQKDIPTDVSAVFPPGHNPASTHPSDITPEEFSWAAITGIDVNGRAVNTAAWGGTADPDTAAEIEPGWRITTTEYDAKALGNKVRTLSANNHYRALRQDPDGSQGTATRIDTRHYYSADGKEHLDSYGPAHPVYDAHPGPAPAPGLTGRWILNEGGGSIAYDASGQGHPGAVDPDVAWQDDAVRGTVALFPGGPEATVTVDAEPVDTARDFTLTVWARLDGAERDGAVLSQADLGRDRLALGYSAERGRWTWCVVGGDDAACAIATAPAQVGTWTSLVATYNAASGQMQIYVDGRLGSVGHARPERPTEAGRLTIGGARHAGLGFTGAISDVRTYDRLLNPGEIRLLPQAPAPGEPAVWAREHTHTSYDTGTEDGHPGGGRLHLPIRTVKDAVPANLTPPTGWWRLNDGHGTSAADTLGANTGTTGGTVTWSTDRGGCAVLDGQDGRITTLGPAITGSGSYSVAAWVKTNTAAPQDAYQTVAAQSGTSTSVFVLRYAKDTDRWQFGDPSGELATSEHPALTATWTHLVGVYDAATHTVTLYVDGHHAGSAPAAVPHPQADGGLEIGRSQSDGAFGNHLHGSVADVRIYDRALSDAEIAVLPDAGSGIGLPAIGDVQESSRAYTLGSDHSGWAMRTPLVTTSDPDGLHLATTITFTPAGLRSAATLPAANASGPVADSKDPHTARTSYYGQADSSDPDTGNRPAWGGQLCKSFRSGQPDTPGLPHLPTRWIKSYTVWGAPIEVRDTVTDAAGHTQTRTTTTTYDPHTWRITKVEATSTIGEPLPAVTTDYDPATGRVTATSTTADKVTTTISRGYDDFGRPTSYTDADGATTTTVYDADGHPVEVTDPHGTRTRTWSGEGEHRNLTTRVADTGVDGPFTGAYDPDGKLTAQTYPGGIHATTRSDEAGHAVALRYARDANLLLGFTRGYDGLGRVCRTASRDSAQILRYDHIGRLQTVLDTDTTTPGRPTTARTYSFDPNSNRTATTTAAPTAHGHPAAAGSSRLHTYDAADRLLPQGADAGLAYDAFGRTTLLPAATTPGAGSPGAADLTLGYYLNDLIHTQRQAGRTITYRLDPARRLAHRTDTAQPGRTQTNHYAGTGDSPSWVEELDGTTTRNLTDLTGALALTASSSGRLVLHLASLHGDTTATLQAEAHQLSTYRETTEYGLPRTPTTHPPRYGYLGAHQRQTDTPTGLLLMGVRLYNPALGRFLQTDPKPNGATSTYLYANADPINRLDLNGQASISSELRQLWHFLTTKKHLKDWADFLSHESTLTGFAALGTLPIPFFDLVAFTTLGSISTVEGEAATLLYAAAGDKKAEWFGVAGLAAGGLGSPLGAVFDDAGLLGAAEKEFALALSTAGSALIGWLSR